MLLAGLCGLEIPEADKAFVNSMKREHYSTTEEFLQQIADKLAAIRSA